MGWMCASHGIPLKASADRRAKNLAISIKQGQRFRRVRRSHCEAVVNDIRKFENKNRTATERSHLQLYVDIPRIKQ